MDIKNIKLKIHAVIASRAASLFLIVCIFGMAAAAAHNGFYTKWKLHEGFDWSVERVLAGTAIKPFIYRQLAPTIANTINENIPDTLRKGALNNLGSVREHGVPYSVIYSINFIFTFLSLFALRQILIDQGIKGKSTIFIPIVFILFIPYLQTVGGYYYDIIELFFFSIAISMAIKGNYFKLLILSYFATYNKESFLFFVPCLYPIMPKYDNPKLKIISLTGTFFISLLTNLYLKIKFQDNDGGFIQYHFLENLSVYLDPRTYFLREITYGIISPSGLNVVTFAFIGIVTFRAWPFLSEQLKNHAIIATVINVPLFILFCSIGELRNLSMLYPTFVVSLAYCLSDHTCEISG